MQNAATNRSWSRVTIELVDPDDPEYGEYDWLTRVDVPRSIALGVPDVTQVDVETAEQFADIRANHDLGHRLARLLAAHPDALTGGRQFRVRVHHPDGSPR